MTSWSVHSTVFNIVLISVATIIRRKIFFFESYSFRSLLRESVRVLLSSHEYLSVRVKSSSQSGLDRLSKMKTSNGRVTEYLWPWACWRTVSPMETTSIELFVVLHAHFLPSLPSQYSYTELFRAPYTNPLAGTEIFRQRHLRHEPPVRSTLGPAERRLRTDSKESVAEYLVKKLALNI